MNAGHAHTRSRHQGGFSLVEILLVVGILAILASIGVGGAMFAKQRAKSNHTKIILKQAVATSTEYQAQTGAVINELGNTPINWSSTTVTINDKQHGSYGATGTMSSQYEDIERFVWAAEQIPAARTVLMTMKDQLDDTDGDGFLEILDSFRNPLRYSQQPQGNNGIPRHARPAFGSGGADGDFSTTDDNLSSIEVGK